MLEAGRIREPQRVHGLCPHEVSGGMGQRLMSATMLLQKPETVIADEPTSALDVSVQAEVLNLLDSLRRRDGLTCLLVAHDRGVVALLCDRMAVMQHGELLETLSVDAVCADQARHPYTRMPTEASRFGGRRAEAAGALAAS